MRKIYLIALYIIIFNCLQAQNFTSIKGKIENLVKGDTISLIINEDFINETHTRQTVYTIVENNRFYFDLSEYDHPIYAQINLPLKVRGNKVFFSLRSNFLVCPNDSIELTIKDGKIHFTGQNANSYNIQYQLHKLADSVRNTNPQFDFADVSKITESFNVCDSIQDISLRYLESNKHALTPVIYKTLKANIVYLTEMEKYFTLNFKKLRSSDIGVNFVPQIKLDSLDDYILTGPTYLPSVVIDKFKYDSCTVGGQQHTLGSLYRHIKRSFKYPLTDHLLTYAMLQSLKSDSLTKYVELAQHDIKNDRLKQILEQVMFNSIENRIVPDHVLHAANGMEHKLSYYRGKVLVLDFWFTGCVGCKEITPYLNRIANTFKDTKVVFLSISIDRNKEQWIESIKNGEYTFNNSTKLYTSGQGQKHPIIDDFRVIGYPTIIIIDQDGKTVRPPIDPRKDNSKDITQLINQILTKNNKQPAT